jgi:DNA repair protein RecN (Recombination protein N)
VLCVTHLPQVASQANQHFQVAKGTTLANGKTASRIDVLDKRRRSMRGVEEVARMLGGFHYLRGN